MKDLGAMTGLLAALCGLSCSRPEPVRPVYAPGDRVVLVYEGGFVTHDAARTSEFGVVEMPVTVSASAAPGCVELHATQRRLITGNAYIAEDGNRHLEQWDSSRPSGTLPGGEEADARRLLEEVRTFDLRATVAAGGTISDFTARMAGMEERLKRAESEEPDPRKRRQLPRMLWGRYLTMLEDSLAYVPPGPVRVGQSWPVHRPMVFPLHEYGFGMAAGTTVVCEEVTCQVQAIHPTPQGRQAVIQIRGWRSYIPGLVHRERLHSMVCRGELHLNLDTGRIVSQWVETRCGFRPGEFPVDVTFYSRLNMRETD